MPPPPYPSRLGRAAKGSLGSGGGLSGTDAAAAAAAVGCIQAIPQELVAEILARVPPDVAFLFRCCLVCKRWRRLLADPAFLRRLFPESGRPSLLGFLVQRHRTSATAWRRRIASLFKNRAPACVPAPGSALGPRRRFLTSFVRDDAGLLQKAEPLAERDGLVLLRVFPRAAAGREMYSLCVCSLLTGKLDVLPPLDVTCFDGEGVRGYAILPSSNNGAPPPPRPADGYSNLFQVLLIGVHRGSKQLIVRSFSTAATALQSWSAKSVNWDAGWSPSGSYGSIVATVCCGKAQWLFQEDGPTGSTIFTFDVCINTGHVCSNKIIGDWSNTRLSLCSNARISLVYQQDNHLVVQIVSDQGQVLLARLCVGKKSDTVLVTFFSNPGCAYLIDPHSRSTTKLAGWKGSFNNETVVPYEINWPELFMSRVGVQL